MSGFADWLGATGLATFLAENPLAFPVLEILHVLAISLVLGAVFIFDLRLLNWGWRAFPAGQLLDTLRPFALTGFVLAVGSGFFLFASQPVSYLASSIFQLKLLLLLAAGANFLLFHAALGRSAPGWDTAGGAIPVPARLSALASLAIWTAILLAGRFVGFFLQV